MSSLVRKHYHFIKMGGTIEFNDPGYQEINHRLMKLDTSIESYIKNVIQPHFTYSSEVVCQKDSRDITEDDRRHLLEAINSSDHEYIIVTHGTFTMKETAVYVKNALKAGKKVIFTGSMIPVIGFTVSDAGFNLGFVLGSFESLKDGVYLSMNGAIFKPEDVEKNIEEFRFE